MHLIFSASTSWYALANWPYYFIALMALGFVIFVHELGHFVVAKLCGVKCEKFYVGFDPPIKIGWGDYGIRLPSAIWKRQWGETEYGIGIIPLGGYVKMLGQDDNPGRQAEMAKEAQELADATAAEQEQEQEAGASTGGGEQEARVGSKGAGEGSAESSEENYITDPRSYIAQTVPERMAIISAGVIMNLIFAWVFATIAFSPWLGVPYTKCDVAFLSPGAAAYQAGILPGDKIIEINGIKKPRFKDLRQEVILAGPDDIKITVERQIPGFDKPKILEFVLKSKKDGNNPFKIIGIGPNFSLTLSPDSVASEGTPAGEVAEKLISGDVIVEVAGSPVKNCNEYLAQLANHADKTVSVKFERPIKKDEDESQTDSPPEMEYVEVSVAPRYLRRYGLEMKMGPVLAVRPDSPAANVGIMAKDQIIKIDGQNVGDPIDLPEKLRRRAGETIVIDIVRPSDSGAENMSFEVQLEPIGWPSRIGSTMSIPSLGVAYTIRNTVAAIKPDTPAASSSSDIQPGDQLVSLTLKPANEEQAAKEKKLMPEGQLGPHEIGGKEGINWIWWVRTGAQIVQPDTSLKLTVKRNSEDVEVTLPPPELSQTVSIMRGFHFVSETDIMIADDLGEAMSLGWRETKFSMLAVYRFLHKLVSGDVSPKLLGGPGTIAVVAGLTAKQGPGSLLIFLTMLSANLAVINFLPIPVLDGGHMVFLILEGIFRRPVSEKIVIPLTWAGLFLILSLMIFVIGLDVNRFIF